MADPLARFRMGIDVGGTFTDIVLIDNATGEVSVSKVLNRQADRAETVAEAVSGLLDRMRVTAEEVGWISHGTTIATNAVLERKGAKTALITNRNFRDILEIGRFARPAELIYRIHEDKPPPLVPRRLRLGVACRIDRRGEIHTELDDSDLDEAIAAVAGEEVESVAVCFLFSFLNPVHEERVRERLRAAMPGLDIVLSSEVLREFREFPRTSTTVFAAYVAPVLRAYVSGLLTRLAERGIACPLYVFQSSGGVATPEIVMRNPALTMLSGPAGAVVGAAEICGRAGYRDLITMDIGGTSLDTCLVRGSVAETATTREIDMFPIAVPMLDIHTIGAGGGSVVRVDEVGRIGIGPESMGARPGPAGRGGGGDRATLTAINLLMGLIDPAGFAGGEVRLDRSRAEAVVEREIAAPLSVDLPAAAVGVFRVATSQIAEAIGTVTTERGSDPRDYALVAFGGGGPLHAAAVARELGIERIVVPRHPGLFSARGIATADFAHDYIQSVLRPIADMHPHEAVAVMEALVLRAAADLDAEGIPADRRELSHAFDLRYVGQTTEISVSVRDGGEALQEGFQTVVARFHRLHERLYSYSVPEEPVELVNQRLRAVGRVGTLPLPAMEGRGSGAEPVGERAALLPGSDVMRPVPVYRRDRLAPGASVTGPALIEEASSTTVVLERMQAEVDTFGNLVLGPDSGARKP
ncbi:MAG: hydantoinase/oxoprolinase family protein [Alphaproteobacteria bacterium]|nr:hydantoinase/oxoprolinase family protein [Alphaproteobacteria bacterium]